MDTVKTELGEAESQLAAHAGQLEDARAQVSRLEGEITTRRATVEKLDLDATRDAVAEIAGRLDGMPVPDVTATDESMRGADQAVADATLGVKSANDAVRMAEGALQTMGGQVVVERYEAAEDAFRQAEQKEREVELDYDAWRLLVEKLREAENTEGQHLGEALSRPVTERFAELTSNRYGKLDLEPSLETKGLQFAGVQRDIGSLSLGTQEQLATLLRLAVAEQLGTTLVLDDHLTQTDPARSAWFRDVLRQHAAKAQVIVVTCRPRDYLFEEDLPAEGEAMAVRAGGIVRAINAAAVITRTGPGSGGSQ